MSKQQTNEIEDWLQSGKYLPAFMRDFHNQKDLFKWIDEVVANDKHGRTETLPSWVDAHVYVVDFFLWLMAKHGWTLQRSRQKLPFWEIEDTVSESRERRWKAMRRFFDERKADGR